MRTKKTWTLGLVMLTLGGQLLAVVAHAREVCDTVESCRALQGKIESRLAALLNGSLTDIARTTGGRILHMEFNDADIYCQSQKQRLPTARELALYAQSLGAQGVSETAKDGYRPIEAVDSQGHLDKFYYSSKGYQRPAGDYGNSWFWSSSTSPYFHDDYYFLNGEDGRFYDYLSNVSDGSVRCVR